MCERLRWNHLPVAGGLYDQHPDLLEDWWLIFEKRHEYEQAKEASERRKGKNRQPRVAGPRR